MTDQKFERKGKDIHTSVTVSFKDAILGTKLTVDTLTQKVTITLQPGTQPGAKLRLKGAGLSVGDSSGDLYVTVIVEIPDTISDEQRTLLDRW